jgi:hypothetical protein
MSTGTGTGTGTGAGIDILFASHNGARTLPRMLAALRKLQAPQRPWRILAVNNACSDETPRLLADAASGLPIVALDCPEPGKMPALKRAAAEAAGDLVIFTDDDVEPAPGWLCVFEAAADAAPQSVGIYGGPIQPTPMETLTPWFEASRDHHAELYALSDQPEGAIDAAAHVYGPNFMLRRAHLDVLNEVAAGLGPTFVQGKAKSFAMGEDTQIMEMIAARGASAHYVRAASVRHLVRAFQTELPGLLLRAERHGRGAAIRMAEAKNRAWTRRLRMALHYAPQAISAANEDRPATPENFNSMWDARWAKGAIQGALFGPYPPKA